MRVIDCHVHLNIIKGDGKSTGIELKKALDCMDRVGIDKANLIPMVVNNGSHVFFPNKKDTLLLAEFLQEVMKEHPDRFFSMLWINPNLEMSFLKDVVSEYVLDGDINGIKFWAEMNAADEALDAFAGFLEENDLPVLFHTWYNTLGKTYFESNPSEIATLAKRHPGLRIIMAHLRGCGYRGVQDVMKLSNVIIDTSGSEAEDGYLEYALKELGPDRIIFGTDYPGRDFAASRGRIDSLELDSRVREKLYSGNADKFFRRRQK